VSVGLTRRHFFATLAAVTASVPHAARAADDRPVFTFFRAFDCPHCKQAKPFVTQLEQQHPELRFESFEVKKDKDGRRRFAKEVKRLGIADPGVPLFVLGDAYVMGWVPPKTKRDVRRMIRRR